jgi:prepilin-type N-terminal cleavage/methylation domain-containing protein
MVKKSFKQHLNLVVDRQLKNLYSKYIANNMLKAARSKTVKLSRSQSGFTLIELLVVILIIVSLAVTVFVALNPAARLKDSRDAKRTSDVDSILSAMHQHIVDAKGITTGLSLTSLDKQLGTGTTGCAIATGSCAVTATACVSLGGPTILGKYLATMPIDPTAGTTFTDAKTGYAANMDANGIVTIKSCGVEGTIGTIQSSR